MNILEAIEFGVLQGLTEFLPVSSSGHLAVLKRLLGYEQVSILFDILLHISTLLAVVIVFRKRIGKLVVSFFRWIGRKADAEDMVHMKVIGVLLLATVITAVLGIGIEEILSPGENIKLVGSMFIVTAGILIAASRLRPGTRGYGEIRPRDAVITGVAQGLGVLPGISRSGITISAGSLAGFDRETAGEFSFILSIPAILGAAVLKIDEIGSLSSDLGVPALLAGMIAGFISGLIALVFLMSLVKKGKLHYFAAYLLPLGIISLLFL